jgi:circadian clock protein KaiC
MPADLPRLSSGIPGLDPLLSGGYLPHRSVLVEGRAGSGKTSVGLQFLAAGRREGQRCFLISLGEHTGQILHDARARQMDVDGIDALDLNPSAEYFTAQRTYDLFLPAEIERGPIAHAITEAVDKQAPNRVFIDSMEQFRYLSPDPFQLRRHVLALMRFLAEHKATVLFSAEGAEHEQEYGFAYLADGVLQLHHDEAGRGLVIRKLRGSVFDHGRHALRLDHRGLQILPRILPGLSAMPAPGSRLQSGIPTLDAMLDGGLETGTITLLTGPSGTGKSTIAAAFALDQACAGRPTLVCSFEEDPAVSRTRCLGLGLPFDSVMAAGSLTMLRVHPMRTSLQGFQQLLLREIARTNAQVVVLDSMTGLALMHVLGEVVAATFSTATMLQELGVTVLLTNEQEEVSSFRLSHQSLGFLCDTILYLRYFERHHPDKRVTMGRAIGVLKKRLSNFEPCLRAIEATRDGLVVGQQMRDIGTILQRMPTLKDGGPST